MGQKTAPRRPAPAPARIATDANGAQPGAARAITSYRSWFDGRIVGPDEAKVSVLSHALHYGTSVFEGIRCYETAKGPAIFRLQDHIRRLFHSASYLHMKVPHTAQAIEDACVKTVAANGFRECYVRPLAFFGEGGLGFKLHNNAVHVSVSTYPLGPFLGEKGLREGVRIKTVSWRKTPSTSVPASAKLGGNYVNALLAFSEASRAGYDEALLLRDNGYVAEGAGDNVFCVRDGELFTPATSEDNLPGITRDSVMALAREAGIPVHETVLSRPNLIAADEVFLCGTAVEVAPVREIDDLVIADGTPGPITRRLQETYFRAVRGQERGFEAWLTRVPS